MHNILTYEDLSKPVWEEIWKAITRIQQQTDSDAIAPRLDVELLKSDIESIDLERGNEAGGIIRFAIEYLKKGGVINHNASNFGPYGNGVTPLGVSIEALVASFNPQLCTWVQSPFGAEVESYLIRVLASRLNYTADSDGCFINSEIEAYQTAIITALENKFNGVRERGLHEIDGAPILYASNQCHPSLVKAARLCGLGERHIRLVPNDEEQSMNGAVLDAMIREDIQEGKKPFMIVGTSGSVKTGAIDPLLELTTIAKHFSLWSHVDIGYGSLAIFQNTLDILLEGLEFADSISLDNNKLLSLPSDSFVFITHHTNAMENAFDGGDNYLPVDAFCERRKDGVSRTAQWSRRFAGLKVFAALAVQGWKAYEEMHRFQWRMAWYLREKLQEGGWQILNKSHLPVICFSKPELTVADLHWIVQQLIVTGRSWISVVALNEEVYCLRASVTNFNTSELEVLSFVEGLEEVIEKIWLRQNRIPEI